MLVSSTPRPAAGLGSCLGYPPCPQRVSEVSDHFMDPTMCPSAVPLGTTAPSPQGLMFPPCLLSTHPQGCRITLECLSSIGSVATQREATALRGVKAATQAQQCRWALAAV